jgi:excisionase family DNA binding protein
VRDWSREEFMTVREVAELLRLNQMTIRLWIDAGKLPAVRVGGGRRRVRVLRSGLDALLAQGYGASRKAAPEDGGATSFWGGST